MEMAENYWKSQEMSGNVDNDDDNNEDEEDDDDDDKSNGMAL